MLKKTILLLLCILYTATCHAATGPKPREITKEQATQLAQQRYPGRIVKVHTENNQYRIRLLQADGRVITVVVDERSGQIRKDDH